MKKQSKLIAQLNRERKPVPKSEVGEEKIEDIYSILTKIDSKNLLISQWLGFMIEKGFIKNSQKIFTFMDIYDAIKGSDQIQVLAQSQSKQEENEKFSKKKFVMALKKVSEKICPYLPQSYERVVYPRIVVNDYLQVRLKVDDVRKFLTREIVEILRKYDRELQIIFQIYMPQNFNGKMGFSWEEIKYLQKKLPIICFFRFLWEAEICPHHITSSQFLEVISKTVPPSSSLNNINPKESLFYSIDSIVAYTKEAITSKKIKLLQGDIGLTFLDFSLVIARLAPQITKEKTNIATALQRFFELLNLKQLISSAGNTKSKPNFFQEHVKEYFDAAKKIKRNNLQLQKRETKKNIEEILEADEQFNTQNKNEFKLTEIKIQDFVAIKKSLDEDHLPSIPPPKVVQKQNDCNYKPEQKHIVIGEQVPKIPEKNKAGPSKKNDKKDESVNRFPMQQVTAPDNSSDHYNDIIKNDQNKRSNSEYPVILTDILYPHYLENLYINPKAQIYLETTYIHLGQKNYEKAYLNFCKAKSLCENSKSLLSQFYFTMLQAQIYESAGRDGMALYIYNKAKEITNNPANKNQQIKALAFNGLAGCLFHMEEYEYALKCYLKFEDIRGSNIQLQSTEKAILENNKGCCLMILNRNTEACKNFKLSHDILDIVQGTFSERTLIAQQNANKNKKAFIQMKPSFKTMWRVYEQKQPFKQEKVVAKGKKK